MVAAVSAHDSYYVCELENHSLASVQFLDMKICTRGNRLIVKPFTKPSNLLRPLSSRSAHAAHGQLGWQLGGVRSVFRLATVKSDAAAAAEVFIDCLRRYGDPT